MRDALRSEDSRGVVKEVLSQSDRLKICGMMVPRSWRMAEGLLLRLLKKLFNITEKGRGPRRDINLLYRIHKRLLEGFQPPWTHRR